MRERAHTQAEEGQKEREKQTATEQGAQRRARSQGPEIMN